MTPANPPGRDDCITPGEVFTPVPWHQSLWDLRTAWAQSRGEGVTVAVLSSGVDGQQQQLDGQVARGRSFLPGAEADTSGDVDCVGLGTSLASLVSAQPVDGVGFRGIAPDSTILPVVVAESTWIAADDDPLSGTPGTVAAGLRYAVSEGADVILVGGYLAEDDEALRAAVQEAIDEGVFVVAPVRDAAGEFSGTAYPAGYEGVLGVSAMAQDLTLVPGTESGESVDIVAPGENIATAARGQGHAVAEGTAAAAALTAAVAALVLGREPDLGPEDVAARVRATAGPVGDEDPAAVGSGLVDAARAVTETAPIVAAAQVSTGSPLRDPDPEVIAARAAADERRSGAGLVAAVGAAAAVFVWAVAWVIAVGRRRGWRAGVRRPAPAPPQAEGVPRALFDTSG
ncbi:MAG: S8 family serine peptidase [Kineosporiaceae bacterium]